VVENLEADALSRSLVEDRGHVLIPSTHRLLAENPTGDRLAGEQFATDIDVRAGWRRDDCDVELQGRRNFLNRMEEANSGRKLYESGSGPRIDAGNDPNIREATQRIDNQPARVTKADDAHPGMHSRPFTQFATELQSVDLWLRNHPSGDLYKRASASMFW
jgi:hypothetical protein